MVRFGTPAKLEPHAGVMVGSQILQVGRGEAIEPVQTTLPGHFANFVEGTVDRVAAVCRTFVQKFYKAVPQLVFSG
jgi:hypothetical protein